MIRRSGHKIIIIRINGSDITTHTKRKPAMADVVETLGFGEPQLAENQEIEHISYGEKLRNSCGGMCIGFLLFFGSLGLAGWNEYRNVASMKSINEAKDIYKEASCSPIKSELDGELVHVTCPLSNFQVLGRNDPVLQGIPEMERAGLALDSYMEIYQWDESTSTHTKQNSVGGGSHTVTTYTYNRKWWVAMPQPVSTFFKLGESCQTQNKGYACLNWNPAFESWWSLSGYSLGSSNIETSKNVKAGDYVVPDSVLAHMGTSKVLTPACGSSSNSLSTSAPTTIVPGATTPSPTNNSNTRRELQSSTVATQTSTSGYSTASSTALVCSPGGASLKGSKMVWQKQDSNSRIIDYLTRSYSLRTADTVSMLAKQQGDTFVFWESTYDEDYGLFEFVDGNLTATEMLQQEEAERLGLTWVLRLLTLLVCIVGLVLITAPLTEIPDIIPFVGPWVGDLIGHALWVVDCLLGCCCWSIVVSLAWIVYRPNVAIALLCISGGMCALGGFFAYANHKKKRAGNNPGSGKVAEEEDIEVAEEYTPETSKEYATAEPEATIPEKDEVTDDNTEADMPKKE
jgi:Transmembrane protein 43